MIASRFTPADAQRAYDEWGANCGPTALAAITGLSLDEVRPHLAAVKFETRRYTSPAMMFAALRSIAQERGLTWRKNGNAWPRWGLARIQWEGPWTEPGQPMMARYRQTHWIGVAERAMSLGVFDVNCLNNGTGWVSQSDWHRLVVPWIVENLVPGGTGRWYVTRTIEVSV